MIQYEHVVEIGAGDSYSSQAWPLSVHARKVTLWEPNSILCADLRSETRIADNVTVRGAAVLSVDQCGEWPFYYLGYASFLVSRPSFYSLSIEPEGHEFLKPLKHMVAVYPVAEAVTEDVDLLILTANGSEESILGGMTARPKTIETKHYLHNARQWNHAQNVFDWFVRERYRAVQLDTNQHSTFLHLRWSR